ncbi:hypothetical protein CKM354_001237800 [Cercospora kikuchii]|nr:uncharacterized protein CKM354_001237800 [Cercospora kikuchii]GIZ49348.1 hypothetical protein CKM354_001237800 [Cercospora kikuchii]
MKFGSVLAGLLALPLALGSPVQDADLEFSELVTRDTTLKVRADAPGCPLRRNNPPRNAVCGVRGNTPGFEAFSTFRSDSNDFRDCYYACYPSRNCVSFAYNSQNNRCLLFSRRVNQMGFREVATANRIYYDFEQCFQYRRCTEEPNPYPPLGTTTTTTTTSAATTTTTTPPVTTTTTTTTPVATTTTTTTTPADTTTTTTTTADEATTTTTTADETTTTTTTADETTTTTTTTADETTTTTTTTADETTTTTTTADETTTTTTTADETTTTTTTTADETTTTTTTADETTTTTTTADETTTTTTTADETTTTTTTADETTTTTTTTADETTTTTTTTADETTTTTTTTTAGAGPTCVTLGIPVVPMSYTPVGANFQILDQTVFSDQSPSRESYSADTALAQTVIQSGVGLNNLAWISANWPLGSNGIVNLQSNPPINQIDLSTKSVYVRGYFIPPVTDTYTFTLAANKDDNFARLWIGPINTANPTEANADLKITFDSPGSTTVDTITKPLIGNQLLEIAYLWSNGGSQAQSFLGIVGASAGDVSSGRFIGDCNPDTSTTTTTTTTTTTADETTTTTTTTTADETTTTTTTTADETTTTTTTTADETTTTTTTTADETTTTTTTTTADETTTTTTTTADETTTTTTTTADETTTTTTTTADETTTTTTTADETTTTTTTTADETTTTTTTTTADETTTTTTTTADETTTTTTTTADETTTTTTTTTTVAGLPTCVSDPTREILYSANGGGANYVVLEQNDFVDSNPSNYNADIALCKASSSIPGGSGLTDLNWLNVGWPGNTDPTTEGVVTLSRQQGPTSINVPNQSILVRGYFVAPNSGFYTFSVTAANVDNFERAWFGGSAANPTEANADIRANRQFVLPNQKLSYEAGTLVQGQALAFTYLWSNGGTQARSEFIVTDSTGTDVPFCNPSVREETNVPGAGGCSSECYCDFESGSGGNRVCDPNPRASDPIRRCTSSVQCGVNEFCAGGFYARFYGSPVCITYNGCTSSYVDPRTPRGRKRTLNARGAAMPAISQIHDWNIRVANITEGIPYLPEDQ